MATEKELLTIENVKESYTQFPREPVVGKLTLSLVLVPFARENASSSTVNNYDTYLTFTLPSGKSLPAPASTHVKQTSGTGFEIAPSVELLTYLHEINDPLINSSEATTLLDLADAKTTDLSGLIEQVQSILSQYTLFANPSIDDSERQNVALVNSLNGSIVGTLDGFQLTEDSPLPDDKSPVVVEFDREHSHAKVRPATQEDEEDELAESEIPQKETQVPLEKPETSTGTSETASKEKKDFILSTGDGISRGLVYASETVTNGLDKAANWYTNKYAPTEKPLVFKESTKEKFHKATDLTGTGAFYTRKAVGSLHNFANSLSERLAKKQQHGDTKTSGSSDAITSVLNRSLIAFTSVLDGVDEATKNLVKGTTDSSTRVIHHRYGEQARDLAREFGNSVYNVTAVYIDIRGISHRAILKSVGKGAIKGILGNKKVVLVDDKETDTFVKNAKQAQNDPDSEPTTGHTSSYSISPNTDTSAGAYHLGTGPPPHKESSPPLLPPRK